MAFGRWPALYSTNQASGHRTPSNARWRMVTATKSARPTIAVPIGKSASPWCNGGPISWILYETVPRFCHFLERWLADYFGIDPTALSSGRLYTLMGWREAVSRLSASNRGVRRKWTWQPPPNLSSGTGGVHRTWRAGMATMFRIYSARHGLSSDTNCRSAQLGSV